MDKTFSFSTFSQKSLSNILLSGLSYGLVATLVAHPFDTLKTIQQTHPNFKPFSTSAASRSSYQLSVKHMYRGFLPSLTAACCFRSIPFVGYTHLSSLLHRHTPQLAHHHPHLLNFIAGSWGGVLRALVECPIELLKVRRQLQHDLPRFSGFFAGQAFTVARNSIMMGYFWAVYQPSLRLFENPAAPASVFLAAAGASSSAWLLAYPLDVIKTYLQADRSQIPGLRDGSTTPASQTRFSSLRIISKHIVGEKGWSGFYAGLAPALIRSTLSTGIGMIAFNFIHQIL